MWLAVFMSAWVLAQNPQRRSTSNKTQAQWEKAQLTPSSTQNRITLQTNMLAMYTHLQHRISASIQLWIEWDVLQHWTPFEAVHRPASRARIKVKTQGGGARWTKVSPCDGWMLWNLYVITLRFCSSNWCLSNEVQNRIVASLKETGRCQPH